MTVKSPPPPSLPDELDRLLRRLRLPVRPAGGAGRDRHGSEPALEHAEVLEVLLSPEAAGDRSTIRTRRRASNLPAGETSTRGTRGVRDPRPDPAGTPGRSIGSTGTKSSRSAAERDGQPFPSKRSGTSRSTKAAPSRGTHPETLAQLLRRHRVDDHVNKAIGELIRVDLVVIDDVGLLPISADAAEMLFRVVDAA